MTRIDILWCAYDRALIRQTMAKDAGVVESLKIRRRQIEREIQKEESEQRQAHIEMGIVRC